MQKQKTSLAKFSIGKVGLQQIQLKPIQQHEKLIHKIKLKKSTIYLYIFFGRYMCMKHNQKKKKEKKTFQRTTKILHVEATP